MLSINSVQNVEMFSTGQSRGESWESVFRSEAFREDFESGDEENYDDMSIDEELGADPAGNYEERILINFRADISLDSSFRSAAPLTVGELQKSLYPLQATADRVGKQVEKFAETLDRLSTTRPQQRAKDNCRDVLPVVLSYKKIAHDTVEQLKKINTHEKQQAMTRSWKGKLRSSGTSSPKSTKANKDQDLTSHSTVDDLKRWEQEEQTWDLFGLMLQVEFPTSQADAQKPGSNQRFVRPSQGPDLHRYSSEQEVWNRFLADDDLAWERHTVVEWLKRCAESSGPDIEFVVKELESNADRGSGLESHSWLYTKEAIKGEKRLRALPQVLEPDTPGIEASLLDADRTKSLITQLDPDAISRQGRNLEKQDHFFERAIWLACWEMVRRGKSWEYMREWCQERVEGWRAIAMRGDPRASYLKDDTSGDNSLAANWLSRALWRKTCALAAKRGGIDEYENAVYGALSGYLPSVKTVSESWNDYLFAHYNSYLLRQFDRYVKANFPSRLPKALLEKRGSFKFSVNSVTRESDSGNEIVSKMKRVIRTSKEAREPFKQLQGSLIAKNFEEYLYEQGHQLALSANTTEKKQILPSGVADLLGNEANRSITMDHHDMLRIVTHMIFIYQDLGMTLEDDNRRIATENFIVAYIDYLRRAGKQQLLPLYAARLSPRRAHSALGRQLAFIQDQRERQMLMRLMSHSGINILSVLTKQLQLSIDEGMPNGSDGTAYPKIQILESTKDEKDFIYPIKKGFMGESMTGSEQSLINGFEWYLLLEDHWQETLNAGTVLYKYLLRRGSLAAARCLSKAVSFSSISLSKTEAILGRAQDISQPLDNSEDEDESNSGGRSTRSRQSRSRRQRQPSSAGRSHNERQLLLQQSRNFRDLEALIGVLDAMEQWKEITDEVKKHSDVRHDRSWKLRLQNAHQCIESLIQPLLHGWLQYPKNDQEAVEFKQMRIAYLPEVVLAYNAILNYDGFALSRDILLKSMDLASIVAAENSDLAFCFMESGRMPELVESLAFTSRCMIQAEESGYRAGKSRKKLDGESLSLWSTKIPPLK